MAPDDEKDLKDKLKDIVDEVIKEDKVVCDALKSAIDSFALNDVDLEVQDLEKSKEVLALVINSKSKFGKDKIKELEKMLKTISDVKKQKTAQHGVSVQGSGLRNNSQKILKGI